MTWIIFFKIGQHILCHIMSALTAYRILKKKLRLLKRRDLFFFKGTKQLKFKEVKLKLHLNLNYFN